MPASSTDPFAALGMPRNYRLEPAALQAAYLRKSASLHPDRFIDPIEQADAARQSAAINDARAILGDDESRANALLLLLGGPAKEQDKSLPDGFLMEMLQVREEMEAALTSDDPVERARLEKWAQAQRQDYDKTIGEMFEQAQLTPNKSKLREIRRMLNAWRYIERMIEQLDPDWKAPG